MADSKSNRNSFAGKVATPKTAGTSTPPAQAIPDTMEALGRAIGARIKLTTAAPHAQTYEGTLSTACPTLNLVFLERHDSPSSPTSNFAVIPIAQIQNFQIVSLAKEGGFAAAQPPIGPVDHKRLEQRLEAKVAKAKEEERNRGKGVTREAQAIFDSFRRINTPIRWHNQEMIVHDSVIIPPPYRPEDCKAAKDKQEVLNRVRKVLEGEKRKIRERESKGGETGGQRLGG